MRQTASARDTSLGREALGAFAAIAALVLLVPLAVYLPWLIVIGTPIVLAGRGLMRWRRASRQSMMSSA